MEKRATFEDNQPVRAGSGARAAVAVLTAAAFGWTVSAPALARARAPQFVVSLGATTHEPAAGKHWVFVVHARDARGRPVTASALVRVVVDGETVDTVGMFGFRGALRRSYTWSPTLRGSSAVLEARVVGPGGTRTVAFPVRVLAVSGHPDFRASIAGASRKPLAGRRWAYVVRAVDAGGRAVAGTAVMRVLVRGRVVDTIGWFGFSGTLRRTYRWSPSLRGSRALIQASVVGPGGTRTVDYPVVVR
jgi:hypothetical protein